MKIGIVSVLIGITGLALITYFNHQLLLQYREMGELSEGVTLYPMDATTEVTLFLAETIGVAFGLMAYRKRSRKIGLFGMGLCALNLILLFSQF